MAAGQEPKVSVVPKLTDEEVLALPDLHCPNCNSNEFTTARRMKVHQHETGFQFIPYMEYIVCFNCKEPLDTEKIAKKLRPGQSPPTNGGEPGDAKPGSD